MVLGMVEDRGNGITDFSPMESFHAGDVGDAHRARGKGARFIKANRIDTG